MERQPVAVMSASGGIFGGARAQYALRQSFVFLNMLPVNQPDVMIGKANEKFGSNGNLTDETSKKLMTQLLQKPRGLGTPSRQVASVAPSLCHPRRIRPGAVANRKRWAAHASTPGRE